MKHIETYTTRWHDTDAFRRVRPTQILVYMQETSNRHMAAMGKTLDALRDEDGLAFLLSRIRLELCAPLYMGEEITVETWTCESRGFGFLRYYRVLRGEEVIAKAETVWALLRLSDRRLCRNDSVDLGFVNDEAPEVLSIPTRFRVPKTEELTLWGERPIRYSDLDYNMHMNNTRYADMLCDYLPLDEVGQIKGMSLAYLHEAGYGQTVSVYGCRKGDGYDVRTVNREGEACLEAEIILA
ncbi:MAG: hypothetical protein IJY42_04235 [Clostridia bacterium]|nr:hypothetical protein [Clostridia bacterium]